MTDTTHTLVAGELPGIRAFLEFQGTWSADKITNVTNADVGNYYASLANLEAAYAGVQNATWKTWYDSLFETLGQKVNDDEDFAEYRLVWEYANWVRNNAIWGPPRLDGSQGYVDEPNPWTNYWYTFRHSYTWSTELTGDDITQTWGPGLSVPSAPTTWSAAVQSLADRWGDTPPENLIDVGPAKTDQQNCVTFLTSVLNAWKGFPTIVGETIAVNQEQHTTATSLLRETQLTADDYFYLLHLLIAVPNGDQSARQLAQKIADLRTTSLEYPNDTFVNQLVYVTLLHLSDPLGSYGWNNVQLQKALQDLEGVILALDPLSTAIKTGLIQSGKVLNSDDSYPMQDPYCPNVGFTQRKSDTLAALDKARTTIVAG